MKNMTRPLAFLLILALAAGLLAGCGLGGSRFPEGPQFDDQTGVSTALGQFVETEIPLPQGTWGKDLVTLPNGALRVALADADHVYVSTTGPDRSTWEQTIRLPQEDQPGGHVEGIALSPQGDIFYSTNHEHDGLYDFRFWRITSGGETREIPVTYPEIDHTLSILAYDCSFTQSGKLMILFGNQDLREVDLETGELSGNRNDAVSKARTLDCAGETAYLLETFGSAAACGESGCEVLTGVLGRQLEQSLKTSEGNEPKITFWQNPDGYLFYTTEEGLFSYIPGGSITEELVSGARSTLGDPAFFPFALTGGEDGSFYVLGGYEGGSVLYRYTYDATVPTVPSSHLRVYSLYEDKNLRQMISQFQKSHPEVAVDLELGLTGEDGVTEADAIRSLNTEILAGDGPDILALDDLSLGTFLEKDLLMDLSEVLSQAEPLLTQVTNCYARNGQVCAVPTTFALSVIYGPENIVSQIQDLDSLVSAAAQAKAEYPEARSVLGGFHPVLLADQFYDSCSAGWVLADGSLDGEKLESFYAAMAALFALDESYQQAVADMMGGEYDLEEAFPYTPGEFTYLMGAMSVCMGDQSLSSGTLDGMTAWANALAGDDQLTGYETAHLSLQASNTFLPRRIMGILDTSPNQPLAAQFLTYMLSDQVQANSLTTGFPVNQAAFHREIAEDRTADGVSGMSRADGTEYEFRDQYPDARRRQALKGWVDSLTTPALTDRTIRSLVMGQMIPCLEGETTPQEAAQNALRSLNLYLTE